MRSSTLLTTTTTLLATTHASTVLLATTPCLDPSYPLTQFSIDLNTANPVPKDLQTVCGLRIVSATDGVDVHSIQCQAFRDAAGTQPGSAVFTYDNPALIATNPVQEAAVKCSVVPTYPTATAAVYRRQDNSTASTSVPLSWSSSFAVVRSTLFSTQTVSVSDSSATPSTLVQTTVVTASTSAAPSSSSSSAESSPAPSTTRLSPATQTGAAGKVGLSVGMAGAAFAALVL